MIKKILIGALALLFVLCAAAFAEGTEIPFAGAGTEESPYLISAKEDLYRFAEIMNDEEMYIDYARSYFKLAADIELNDCSDFGNWDVNAPENNWTPIGKYHTFYGVFDGAGHTISGLYINQAMESYEYNGSERLITKFGLFGNLGGDVKDLTIANAFVHPKYAKDIDTMHAGILAGNNGGVISGCTVEGVVICESGNCGGIAGSNYGDIESCTFEGKLIERTAYVGGAIGGIAGTSGNIRNSSVNAQIFSENTVPDVLPADMGGIVGLFSAFSDDECIENCSFSGEIHSNAYAGGIVADAGAIGAYDDTKTAVILNCINNGSVIAAEDAGGIVGLASNSSNANEVRVDGCINRGNVQSLLGGNYAVGGIVGYIDTRHDGAIVIANCVNESELRAYLPGGIVGRLMQNRGNVRVENCVNKGAIIGEGNYAGGILCHIQQWGDNWTVVIDQCANEGDITTVANAGGIVCFAFDADAKGKNRALTISSCINRGDLCSDGINNYMGGILGVDAMAKVPVNIVNCANEGDLEYTREVLVDAETLSGTLMTLSRTSGGIVGYVGTAPYLSLNSGERKLNNINVENAHLGIADCSFTGNLIHKEAKFADDVTAEMIEDWKLSGYENVLNFFPALEGGVVGTIADEKNYSVNITDCSYANAEREIDDWNRFDTEKHS